jgi:vitamin B12 transporter
LRVVLSNLPFARSIRKRRAMLDGNPINFVEDWEAGENPALPRNCERVRLLHEFGREPTLLATVQTAWEGYRVSVERPEIAEPGDLRERRHQPLSRAKEDCLPIRRVLFLLLFTASAFCADLQVRILDPNSAVVNTARVMLLTADGNHLLSTTRTSAEGIARFENIDEGSYRVRVLAPGFAEKVAQVTAPLTEIEAIQLSVAATPQTVVVTAAATPVPAESTGVSISTLESTQLTLLNPTEVAEALRFVPGATVSSTGRTGALSTLFVRGGESRYNKVLVDNVPVNDAGGTFDFGVVPTQEVDRIELLRGSASTLYGSDAMSSVVQLFSATGSTRVPEIRFGADGGTFGTANGYLALAGARGRFDYNIFGDQFSTEGQGINDDYFNSSQGANLGARLATNVGLRVRVRHSNSRTGTPNNWWFNGAQLVSPDTDGYARQNNLLASADLSVAGPGGWQHRATGFEYNHQRRNTDNVQDVGRPLGFDDPFDSRVNFNRAGFNLESEHTGAHTHTVLGYRFEDENGSNTSTFVSFGFPGATATHGLRRNQAIYGEQLFTLNRFSVLGGLRYEHNESFGDKLVPRVATSMLVLRGGQVFSGTRLRLSYAQGIKAPTFEESFGISGSFLTDPNPALKPEKAHSIDAGFEQNFLAGRFALSGIYFHNVFDDQIQFKFDLSTFTSQYVNTKRAIAHGAEVVLDGHLTRNLSVSSGYVYTSSQQEECVIGTGCTANGAPLLRRPKHSANVLISYVTSRWGGSVGGTFVGRRPDSDFFGGTNGIPIIDHAAGYGRVDVGGWYAINKHMTAYVNVANALNKKYNDVVGYPGLKANFRAGMRFRFGGE